MPRPLRPPASAWVSRSPRPRGEDAMPPKPSYLHLSRRERQILDVLYREGRASAALVREKLPDPPSYSAVRALLRILEDKGAVRHESEGLQYIYSAAVPRDQAKQSALTHLVSTFFGGSAEAVL